MEAVCRTGYRPSCGGGPGFIPAGLSEPAAKAERVRHGHIRE
jgi:hypothetical protein